jgi:hypothetical protein
MSKTSAPKLFFESPARVRVGLSGLKKGRLFVTSRDIFFVDDLHSKLFEIPIHTIQDIYFRKNHRIVEITEHDQTHVVYPGLYAYWKTAVCIIGLVLGIVPGVIIYFALVHPAVERNEHLTKKLQNTLAKHAITFE